MLSLRPNNSCLNNRTPCLASHSTRRSLHVVRFKEGDELEEGQPADPAPQVTDRHIDPIRRRRDAQYKLLGRHSHSGSSSSSDATLAQPQASLPSRALPAFEAPLNVPMFSRRREVRFAVLLGPPSAASQTLIRARLLQVLVGRVAMAAFFATCQWEVSMAAAECGGCVLCRSWRCMDPAPTHPSVHTAAVLSPPAGADRPGSCQPVECP